MTEWRLPLPSKVAALGKKQTFLSEKLSSHSAQKLSPLCVLLIDSDRAPARTRAKWRINASPRNGGPVRRKRWCRGFRVVQKEKSPTSPLTGGHEVGGHPAQRVLPEGVELDEAVARDVHIRRATLLFCFTISRCTGAPSPILWAIIDLVVVRLMKSKTNMSLTVRHHAQTHKHEMGVRSDSFRKS